jgi:hypothetical protein
MRIPDAYADADPDPERRYKKLVPKFLLLIRSSILCDTKLKILNILLGYFKETVQREFSSVF